MDAWFMQISAHMQNFASTVVIVIHFFPDHDKIYGSIFYKWKWNQFPVNWKCVLYFYYASWGRPMVVKVTYVKCMLFPTSKAEYIFKFDWMQITKISLFIDVNHFHQNLFFVYESEKNIVKQFKFKFKILTKRFLKKT